jgi:heat shock protein HslJ
LAGTQATLTLSADGRVAGSSGANRFFGTYRVDDTGELQFAALGRTRLYRRDPPGVMQQEQQIFDALEAVTHYRLEADRLTLISAEQPLLRFAAAEQEPTPTPGP